MKSRVAGLVLVGIVFVIGAGLGRAEDVKNAYKQVDKLLSSPMSVVGETIYYPGGAVADITSAIVTIRPGEKTSWHKHGVPLFVYILSGEVTVEYGEKGKRTFKAGSAFMEAMDHWHRGTNTGTEPARILVVYLGAEGMMNVIQRE